MKVMDSSRPIKHNGAGPWLIYAEAETSGHILGSGCVVPRYTRLDNLVAPRTAFERYGSHT